MIENIDRPLSLSIFSNSFGHCLRLFCSHQFRLVVCRLSKLHPNRLDVLILVRSISNRVFRFLGHSRRWWLSGCHSVSTISSQQANGLALGLWSRAAVATWPYVWSSHWMLRTYLHWIYHRTPSQCRYSWWWRGECLMHIVCTCIEYEFLVKAAPGCLASALYDWNIPKM